MSRPARLLVVEDNEDSRLLLGALLADRYEVALVVSGFEALDWLDTHRPDIILMDASMPGMDGLELIGRVRARPGLERLPIVALTARAMRGDRELFLAAGFDAYLSKPLLDEQLLFDALDAQLRRARNGTGRTPP